MHSESKIGINLWGKMSAKIECLIHFFTTEDWVSISTDNNFIL